MAGTFLKTPEEIFREKIIVAWMDCNAAKQAIFNAIGELHASLDVSTENIPQFEKTAAYVQAGVELSTWLYNWRHMLNPTKEERKKRDEDGKAQEGPSED